MSEALGRVLAAPVVARRTQPPVDVSAMDGYAVRSADVASPPATLLRTGVSAAGNGFDGVVKAGETVRIFTGAPVPEGADAIAIQENADIDGDAVTVREAVSPGRYVRKAGLDFAAGDPGLSAGRRLGARDLALAAAMNHPWLVVRRRPRVAIPRHGRRNCHAGRAGGARPNREFEFHRSGGGGTGLGHPPPSLSARRRTTKTRCARWRAGRGVTTFW